MRWLVAVLVLVGCSCQAPEPVDATFGMSGFKRVENCGYKIERELTGCVVFWSYAPHDAKSPHEVVVIIRRDGSSSITGPVGWDANPHRPADVKLAWGERADVCGAVVTCAL